MKTYSHDGRQHVTGAFGCITMRGNVDDSNLLMQFMGRVRVTDKDQIDNVWAISFWKYHGYGCRKLFAATAFTYVLGGYTEEPW